MVFFEDVVMPPVMTMVDVGAMMVADQPEPLERLCKLGRVNVIGFEPLRVECDKLNALQLSGRRYLPYAVGNGERRKFHVTNTGMTSSLLKPNLRLASLFNNLAEFMQVIAIADVATMRLDDIAEIKTGGCDLLKLDTQGSELEILLHAGETLKRCLIVQTEVEFVPLYENQPLFADIDQLLRARGFMFHRFSALSGRTYRPMIVNKDPNAALSQVLWSNAVYVPDVCQLDRLDPDALLKLAALLHEVYRSFDLCNVVLSAFDRRAGTAHAARYLDRIAGTRQLRA